MTEDDLSEAFYPCNTTGLAASLWEKNQEIGAAQRLISELRKERQPIYDALLALMQKGGESVIEGSHPTLRLVWDWEYDHTKQSGKRIPGLEFDKERPLKAAAPELRLVATGEQDASETESG